MRDINGEIMGKAKYDEMGSLSQWSSSVDRHSIDLLWCWMFWVHIWPKSPGKWSRWECCLVQLIEHHICLLPYNWVGSILLGSCKTYFNGQTWTCGQSQLEIDTKVPHEQRQKSEPKRGTNIDNNGIMGYNMGTGKGANYGEKEWANKTSLTRVGAMTKMRGEGARLAQWNS